MKRAYILYFQFFDRLGKELRIGGIETYIYNLCKLLNSNFIEPIIYQFADINFTKIYNGYKIVGIKTTSKNYIKNSRIVAKKIQEVFDFENDIMIFASEPYVVPFPSQNTIAIQHGISWDVPNNGYALFNCIKNTIRACREYRQLNKCTQTVCVDYNIINWYRAVFKKYDCNRFHVIPNFCDTRLVRKKTYENNHISIVFARRFQQYRGAILFANVAKKLLEKYLNLEICFAGEGPCEHEIKSILQASSNVRFTTFSAEASIDFHSSFDIAVVPTIGSEGTSLSLLEAMAAGCAVVCTNVGGMTNIILNGYNGIMISPSEEELYAALKELIENYELRKFLSQKAVETVSSAFSKEKWEQSWLKVISNMTKKEASNEITNDFNCGI